MRREMGIGLALAALVVVALIAAPAAWHAARKLPRVIAGLSHRADQRVVTFQVVGMTCPKCSDKVEREIERVPGVTTASVRLDQGEVQVVCRRSIADSLLTGAVARAGPGFRALPSRR